MTDLLSTVFCDQLICQNLIQAHWRKGRELYLMNKYDEAFDAFLLGCRAVQPVCDDIIDLLYGAVMAFPDVPGMSFFIVTEQLEIYWWNRTAKYYNMQQYNSLFMVKLESY